MRFLSGTRRLRVVITALALAVTCAALYIARSKRPVAPTAAKSSAPTRQASSQELSLRPPVAFRLLLFDEATLQGLRGARVALRDEDGQLSECVSDQEGTVRLTRPAGGSFEVFVGLRESDRRVIWHTERIASPKEADTVVRATIPRTTLVRGLVTDEVGNALAGERVRLRVVHTGNPEDHYALFGKLTGGNELLLRTDDQGRFLVESVNPECFLTFGVDGWPAGSLRAITTLQPRPSGRGYNATPRSEHTVHLARCRAPELMVKVHAGGLPVEGSHVSAYLENPARGEMHPFAVARMTNKAGESLVSFPLPKGEDAHASEGRRLWVYACHPDVGFASYAGRFVQADALVALELTRGSLTLTGRIVSEDTNAGVAGSDVFVQANYLGEGTLVKALTDEQGGFRVTVPAPPLQLPPHMADAPKYFATVHPRQGTLTHVPVLVAVELDQRAETQIRVRTLPPKK